MPAPTVAAQVAIAILVATSTVAGPVASGPVATGGTTPAVDGTRVAAVPAASAGDGQVTGDVVTVGGLQTELQSERAVLDDLMATMLVEDRLYERLAELQFQRVVHRSRMSERVSVQEAALGDLSREYYSMQHEPQRVADIEYEIEQSIRTLDHLSNVTAEQQALVEELQARIEAENGTLDELDTPLAEALVAQRASQLRGLEYVAEQLAVQEEQLAVARSLQEDRLEYVEHYQDIWRELETIERRRVLDRLDAEFDETHQVATLQDSRFEGERYVVALLREHHHARMETVVEYTAFLWSLEDDLATLGDEPTPEAVEALQARLDEQAAALSAVRDALATESAVTGQLREEMAAYEDRLEDRESLLWSQTTLAIRLESQSTHETQNRTVTALERRVEEEAAMLDAMDEQLRAEQRLVGELSRVGTAEDVRGRLAAYLRVRDDVVDLLEANLDEQRRLVEVQSTDVRAKERAAIRLGWDAGVQDTWRRLPAFNETVRLSRLDAEVLDHRFEGQQEAFGLLTDIREESDATFEGQQRLLADLQDDLDEVATAVRTTDQSNATGALNASAGALNPTADRSNASADRQEPGGDRPMATLAPTAGDGAGAAGLVGFAVVLLLLVLSAVLVVWSVRSSDRPGPE